MKDGGLLYFIIRYQNETKFEIAILFISLLWCIVDFSIFYHTAYICIDINLLTNILVDFIYK